MDLDELVAREGVRDTIARYNASGDRGDMEGLAGCFTADGVLAIVGREPIVGRDAIRTGLTGALRREPTPDDPRPAIAFAHHHVATVHIVAVTRAEIDSVCYFTVLTQVGLDHWGRYRDRLVPVGERWLFARRDVKVDGYAPTSLFPRR